MNTGVHDSENDITVHSIQSDGQGSLLPIVFFMILMKVIETLLRTKYINACSMNKVPIDQVPATYCV